MVQSAEFSLPALSTPREATPPPKETESGCGTASFASVWNEVAAEETEESEHRSETSEGEPPATAIIDLMGLLPQQGRPWEFSLAEDHPELVAGSLASPAGAAVSEAIDAISVETLPATPAFELSLTAEPHIEASEALAQKSLEVEPMALETEPTATEPETTPRTSEPKPRQTAVTEESGDSRRIVRAPAPKEATTGDSNGNGSNNPASHWAAQSKQVSGREPAAPIDAPSPAVAQPLIHESEPVQAGAGVVRDLSLNLRQDGVNVQVRVSDRPEQVSVSVRTGAEPVNAALREHLPELAARLESRGIEVKTVVAAGGKDPNPVVNQTQQADHHGHGEQGSDGRRQKQQHPGSEPGKPKAKRADTPWTDSFQSVFRI